MLAGLGLALNPSDYRYITIGILRRFLSKNLGFQADNPEDLNEENDPEYKDNILDL